MNSVQIDIDSLRKEHWSQQDHEYAETVLNFVQTLMNDHDLELLQKQYSGVQYKQHNRRIEDGIAGVLAYFKKLVKQFPEFSYEVKNVMVDGDRVTIHAHSTLKHKHRGNERKGMSIMDTWRIKDGKLVEHWDVIQPLDTFMRFFYFATGGAINNRNSIF